MKVDAKELDQCRDRIRRTVIPKAENYVKKMGIPEIFGELLKGHNGSVSLAIFETYEKNWELELFFKEGDAKDFAFLNHFKVRYFIALYSKYYI